MAELGVLKQGDCLIASIPPSMTDEWLIGLQQSLLESVSRLRARGVIIDVTALELLDSFATRTLRDIAAMVKLRGAETVIVGIQPEVAYTMVQLGLSLDSVATALDLEEGVASLRRTPREALRLSH